MKELIGILLLFCYIICINGNNECTFGVELTRVNTDPYLAVGIIIDCQYNTVNITMEGPDNKYFGIVFGDRMRSTQGNPALIYTTGKANDMNPHCGNYLLTQYDPAGVNIISNPSYIEKSLLNIDGKVKIQCDMKLNDTNGLFSIDTELITFGYAFGYDLELAYHDDRCDVFETYNLKSGKTGVDFLYIMHGICMWTAWMIFGFFGIFSSFHRNLYKNYGDLWFSIHLVCQILCLILQLIGLTLIMIAHKKSNDSVFPKFTDLHEGYGFIIIIVSILQPINAIFKGKPNDNTKKRKIWELIHKTFGYFALISSPVIAGLGIKKITDNLALLLTHIIYVIILFIIFIIFATKIKKNKKPTKKKVSELGLQSLKHSIAYEPL